MAKNGTSETLKWFGRFNPACNITGLLMFIGCSSTVYFTYHFEWDPWAFGGVFALIMGGGKAMKVFGDRFGQGLKK